MIRVLEIAHGGPDFALCFALRWEVFVGEQNVPADEEADEHDATARHFLALYHGEPAGTARALVKAPGLIKIGRVAVRKPFRKSGIGAALMRAVEASCPNAAFMLDAQTQALPFYERLGYAAEGDMFTEAGIAHRRMVKPAVAACPASPDR